MANFSAKEFAKGLGEVNKEHNFIAKLNNEYKPLIHTDPFM